MKRFWINTVFLVLTFPVSSFAVGFETPITCMTGSFYENGQVASYFSDENYFVIWTPEMKNIQAVIELGGAGNNSVRKSYSYQKRGSISLYRAISMVAFTGDSWKRGMLVDVSWLRPVSIPNSIDDQTAGTSSLSSKWKISMIGEQAVYTNASIAIDSKSLSGRLELSSNTGKLDIELSCWQPKW